MVFSVLCFFFKPASWHLLLYQYRSIHFHTHISKEHSPIKSRVPCAPFILWAPAPPKVSARPCLKVLVTRKIYSSKCNEVNVTRYYPPLCVCVCVCVRERERESACVCVCVWVWEWQVIWGCFDIRAGGMCMGTVIFACRRVSEGGRIGKDEVSAHSYEIVSWTD